MPGTIGIDIVEVARISRLAERYGDRFLRRIFTAGELATCFGRARPDESLAARFAAKEAFAKAWTGPVMPGWHDVEIVMNGRQPEFALSGVATGTAARVSLSHTREHAVAVAWIDSEEEKR